MKQRLLTAIPLILIVALAICLGDKCRGLSFLALAIAIVLAGIYEAFTMVDIILNRKSFEEFLQFQVRPTVLANAMERILPGGSRRAEVEHDMAELRQMLEVGSQNATANAARHLLSTIGS